ncbi:MAG: hypothetical protein LBT48_08730 [Prevotellaceae bacterium]|jgi:nucleoid DNA-binding protein|nr:hypothetical protein [Prevotellaceae bacterium]
MIEMSIVSELLCRLLQTHNRVSLSGLGAFLVSRVPADFVKGGKMMLPPSKRITFSTSETWNDGLLEDAVAQAEGYTPEGAQRHMADFLQNLNRQLTSGQRVEFPGLGTLRITADGELAFTPFDTIENPDTFGLLELEMPPLPIVSTPEPLSIPMPSMPSYTTPSTPSYQPAPPSPPHKQPAAAAEPPRSTNRYKVIIWILAILVLLALLLFFFRQPIRSKIERMYYTPDELMEMRKTPATDSKANISNTNATETLPAGEEKKVTPSPPATDSQTTGVQEQPKQAPVQEQVQEQPKQKTRARKARQWNKFHIILAQYNDEETANIHAQKMQDLGFDVKVLYADNENLYKISILRYNSWSEAEDILKSVKNTDVEFRDAWVEKY